MEASQYCKNEQYVDKSLWQIKETYNSFPFIPTLCVLLVRVTMQFAVLYIKLQNTFYAIIHINNSKVLSFHGLAHTWWRAQLEMLCCMTSSCTVYEQTLVAILTTYIQWYTGYLYMIENESHCNCSHYNMHLLKQNCTCCLNQTILWWMKHWWLKEPLREIRTCPNKDNKTFSISEVLMVL